MRLKRFLESENGANPIWYALALVVVLGIAALVVDYGLPAFDARKMQNAADSAAYAASQELPVKTSDAAGIADVKDIAYEYMSKNGFSDVSSIEVTLGEESNSQYLKVTVAVHDTVEYTFAHIFGKSTVTLDRSAAVQLIPLSGVKYSVPISIEKSIMDAQISSGNYYMTLKFGGGSGSQGAYGAIDSDGSEGGGANDYRERMKHGYDGILYVGDVVPTENGNMSGPTMDGASYRCLQCTHYPSTGGCTPEHYDPDCPRVMLVPVITYLDAHSVKIEGFAPFLIDTYTGSGNESYIYGTYLPGMVVEGEISSTIEANPYGTYARKLVD